MNVTVNPYVLDIKTLFLSIKKNRPDITLKFVWIPSHIGISGNEAADFLVNEAAIEPDNQDLITPYTDLVDTFKKEDSVTPPGNGFN